MFGGNTQLKKYEYTSEEIKKFAYAKFSTSKGDIIIKLTAQSTINTVSNFVFLVKEGFYDGLNFHRVIDGFMAQGGCPDGNGAGGPDWAIECETNLGEQIHKVGSLSMAHAGKNTGGSQFFITFVACPHLDGGHTVFGNIQSDDEKSFEVLKNIKQGDLINKVEILENI